MKKYILNALIIFSIVFFVISCNNTVIEPLTNKLSIQITNQNNTSRTAIPDMSSLNINKYRVTLLKNDRTTIITSKDSNQVINNGVSINFDSILIQDIIIHVEGFIIKDNQDILFAEGYKNVSGNTIKKGIPINIMVKPLTNGNGSIKLGIKFPVDIIEVKTGLYTNITDANPINGTSKKFSFNPSGDDELINEQSDIFSINYHIQNIESGSFFLKMQFYKHKEGSSNLELAGTFIEVIHVRKDFETNKWIGLDDNKFALVDYLQYEAQDFLDNNVSPDVIFTQFGTEQAIDILPSYALSNEVSIVNHNESDEFILSIKPSHPLQIFTVSQGSNPIILTKNIDDVYTAHIPITNYKDTITINVNLLHDSNYNKTYTINCITPILYVSDINASDTNTGSKNSPLPSVQQALTKIKDNFISPWPKDNEGKDIPAIIKISGTINYDDASMRNGGTIIGVDNMISIINGINPYYPPIILQGKSSQSIATLHAQGSSANNRRVLYIKNAQVTLGENITITGAYTNNTDGGGVYAIGSTFTINGGTISLNEAKNGGGIFVDNSTFTMINGTISQNKAINSNGGGIYIVNSNLAKISGGTITKNTATNDGGGIFLDNSGSFVMTEGTISENIASNNGGGIFLNNSKFFSMNDGKIIKNQATNKGGGIFLNDNSDFFLKDSIISENTTLLMALSQFAGGGVYINNTCYFRMSGSSITKNKSNNGGGIYSNGVLAIEKEGNISENSAHNGGGIYSDHILNISGGDIHNNTATNNGGGIYLNNVLNMSGGSVVNNTAAIDKNLHKSLSGTINTSVPPIIN